MKYNEKHDMNIMNGCKFINFFNMFYLIILYYFTTILHDIHILIKKLLWINYFLKFL